MTIRSRLTLPLLAAALLAAPAAAQTPGADAASLKPAADRLITAATRDSAAWLRIAELADRFGPRLSGSAALEQAIDWIVAEMKEDGLENVHTEPVMVPHWVRGAESAELLAPRAVALHMIGLGGSVATPPEGISAEVLVVDSFDDLTRRAAEAKGKIVLFDVPFVTYGETVAYRSGAASAAAKVGAVAALIRSIEPYGIQTPHTGSMRYDSAVARKIPTAALSLEDALMLRRISERGETVRVRLKMSAQTLPDAPSRNVIAELRGSERPDEVVIVSGHIDSWDVGTGSMDDGGGCVAAWQALKLMKELGLRPRRTVRVVLWTNEENGTRGGKAYRDAHRAELGRHVLAIESDNGVFRPYGFRFQGSAAGLAVMESLSTLLAPIEATKMVAGEGEADVEAIIAEGVPGLALDVDGSRYFWYHHSAGDTPDKLDPRDVARSVAAMGVMAYAAAQMELPIPR
jgi:carboxypeptidase Q